MVRYRAIMILFILSVLMCTGCGFKDTDTDYSIDESTTVANTLQPASDSENNRENIITIPSVYRFEMEDVIVEPNIHEYSFEDAMQIGECKELVGIMPGSTQGTWYTVKIDGVEYYYGSYDTGIEEYKLFGWSIVDDTYKLANGIKVGMNEVDILEKYPNMAVIDFENNFIYGETSAFMGWNGVAYPRSYIGMDSSWDYEGKDDYSWTDQFDYIIAADINLNDMDALPQYLGLLIKDNIVSAITFYYPTAG